MLTLMSYSGFLTPTLFNQEIVDFFTHANIGPLINGQFVEKTDKTGNTKNIPDINSLQVTQQKLNDVLNFTKPEDPDYRIYVPGSLTPLFVLHAHYTDMQHANDKTRLSASQEMRQYLRQTMIKVIEKDANEILMDNADLTQQINETQELLIQCIDNPMNIVPELGKIHIGEEIIEIFNPNWFLYAHFSKLISAAKPEMNSVMREQHNIISLARAHKNTNK